MLALFISRQWQRGLIRFSMPLAPLFLSWPVICFLVSLSPQGILGQDVSRTKRSQFCFTMKWLHSHTNGKMFVTGVHGQVNELKYDSVNVKCAEAAAAAFTSSPLMLMMVSEWVREGEREKQGCREEENEQERVKGRLHHHSPGTLRTTTADTWLTSRICLQWPVECAFELHSHKQLRRVGNARHSSPHTFFLLLIFCFFFPLSSPTRFARRQREREETKCLARTCLFFLLIWCLITKFKCFPRCASLLIVVIGHQAATYYHTPFTTRSCAWALFQVR